MKKMLIMALVVVFTLSMTVVAFGYGYDTSGTTTIGGNTYYISGEVTDPHGGYAVSTDKCKVCHAIHQATGTYVLLRSGATSGLSACEACHVAGAPLTQLAVYGGSNANYDSTGADLGDRRHTLKQSGTIDIPDSVGVTQFTNGFTCSHCHSVHGANCYNNCIVKLDGNKDGKVQLLNGTSTSLAGYKASGVLDYGNNSEVQNQFCADCHSLNFYTTTGNKTHVMTDTTNTMYSGVSQISVQTAWESSRNCRRCHRGGLSGGAGSTYTGTGFNTYATTYASASGWDNSFPHMTKGKYFLKDAYTTTGLDSVCIDCHRDPADSANTGVGKTY
ncbi:hypothetical protein [Candidatus Oleimmundimicrobium sp.]|uniref:hypothetical protein n=1 Tax=Candidatus Oleimmundimicrobium sp. TaxID=3060597 RepID=UPI0027166A9F|nr:hypothetical protein [Candidatus Oleimmundimicrobium sp.]MDO8886333.1 hypothetical protein [Candidatus Oleimmundimicrobium sp.]